MCNRRHMDRRRQAWWGVLLLGLGVLFLVRQMASFDAPGLGGLWPAFLIAFGIVKLANYRVPRDAQSGLIWSLVGVWFLANELNWWDARWRETWPLLLVIWGFAVVVRALLEQKVHSNAGGEA